MGVSSRYKSAKEFAFSIEDSSVLNDRLPYILLGPGIVFLLVVVAFPTVFALFLTVNVWELTGTQGVYIGLENYQALVHDPRFVAALGRSVYFTVAAVSIELLLGLLISLGLYRIRRATDFLLSIFLIPMAITTPAIAYAFVFIYHPQYGFVNHALAFLGMERIAFLGNADWALNAVILTDVWQWTPLMILIIYAGLEALPSEPLEAAAMDGASAWQRFKWVTLPLLKPVIGIALLIRGMDAFKAFGKFYIMTNGGPGTSSEVLSLLAYKIGFQRFEIGYATSVAEIMFFIILVASWLYVRTSNIMEEGVEE
jgi:multiple sugar transport system permease protein